MGKYDFVLVHGQEREQVLAEIHAQLAQWGLTMPSCEPLVLDFGLNRFRDIGETEFWIANEDRHGYCGKFLFVFDGQTCPYHHHVRKHETFFIVKGVVRMRVGDEVRQMREGDVLSMPPLMGHSFTGIGPALVLEVSMPSVLDDNFFDDPRIGRSGVI